MAQVNLVVDFLDFVEGQPRQSLRHLLGNVLRKSRMITAAEAGTIFILRRRGPKVWLEPASIQNDAVHVRRTDFIVPLGAGTIAGYVAETGETVRIDDVYAIPKSSHYHFDPAYEHPRYRTRSMLCFPLKNYQDKIIGVVQLLNSRAGGVAEPVPFDAEMERLVMPIARVVGTSIERVDMLEKIRGKNRTLRERNRQLDEQRAKIASLQAETEEAFQLSVRLLARAAEIHDEGTGNHIMRVNEYSYYIAQKLGMSAAFCDEVRYSAQLHDVGKMSVDVAVLKKEGPLTDGEREEMDRHPIYGHQILSASPRLKMGAEIALYHHEKWDGTGYPYGVKGNDIPLSARIVQVADVYDALRSQRPYKPALSHAQAVKVIIEGDDRIDVRGHFDPCLVDLFARYHGEFDRIWQQWLDA